MVTAAPVGTDDRSTRLALWVFVAILAAALPIILFGLGSYRWFFADDLDFLSGRELSVDRVFTPHNVHWVSVPVVLYRALYTVFGMRSYVPYQACVVILHLAVCALLRVIMRRVDVQPWIATFAAASFVFFGPGNQNIVWAFQIGLTGSLAFGLAQLVLGDHDGPIGGRDVLGVGAGLLALMSSGLGISMAVVAGVAMLGRRGWKAGLFHSVPLAAAYIAWWLAERPELAGAAGRPPLDVLFRWLRSGETGVFTGLGHYRVVAVALGIVFVVGLVLAWGRLPRADLRRCASVPVAMLVGGLLFSTFSAMGRWYNGADYARASRYLHVGVALALPAIAVAMNALARRWRLLTVPLIALLVVAVPANVNAFGQEAFDAGFMANRERVVRNVIRMPEAREVPRDLLPLPDRWASRTLTIGWLLGAERAGKLRAATGEMTPAVKNEMRVRLGVDQRRRGYAINCRTHTGAFDLDPAKGDVIGISKPVIVATHVGNEITSVPIEFDAAYGRSLTIRLDGLHLRLAPKRGFNSFTTCESVSQTELLTRLVRSGVAQSAGGVLQGCRTIERSTSISPRKGAVLGFEGTLVLSTHDGPRRTSPFVTYRSRDGNVLTVNVAGLHLRLDASPGSGSFRLCSVG